MMITTTTLTIMALAVVVGFMCIGSSSGDHVDTVLGWLVMVVMAIIAVVAVLPLVLVVVAVRWWKW